KRITERIQSILSCGHAASGTRPQRRFLDYNEPSRAGRPASNSSGGNMRLKSWLRTVPMAALVMALVAAPGARNALAQQEGPQAPVEQQPEPTKPPSGAPAQPPQPQPPPPQVSISVQSNLVNVDAVVTDQDGNLVTGLKRENFRILDEGLPQQVSNF